MILEELLLHVDYPPLFISVWISHIMVKHDLIDEGGGTCVVSLDFIKILDYSIENLKSTQTTCQGYDH